MRWYHATRMLDRKSNSRNCTESCNFLDRLFGGVLSMGFFFLHLDHLLIYYVLPKLVLKKYVSTCLLMAIILQLQCFKTTNSDECFDQTQQSLRTLQSILLWLSPHPRPHPNLTLLLPEVEASSTEHSLFFFFQMNGILLCFSALPKMPLNPPTILHLFIITLPHMNVYYSIHFFGLSFHIQFTQSPLILSPPSPPCLITFPYYCFSARLLLPCSDRIISSCSSFFIEPVFYFLFLCNI